MTVSSAREVFHSKVVLLGSSAVGKSSLACRFTEGVFDTYREPTIGAAFVTKSVELPGSIVKLDIWDTAGQERYRALAPMYYRDAGAVLIVYDVTDEYSYEAAQRWFDELEARNDTALLALVANKTDLGPQKEVQTQARGYAEDHGMLYFETSAKTGDGVDALFCTVAEKVPKTGRKGRGLRIHETRPTRHSCCTGGQFLN